MPSAVEGVLLARTTVPRLPRGHLPRPRLTGRLLDGLDGRLSLIVAAAGYGKTTLMVEALAAADRPFVWLSCDERMSGAREVVSHLAQALGGVFPGVGSGLARDGAPADLVRALSNEVAGAAREDLVVALDDLHSLPPAGIGAVAQLLGDLPAGVHLLMAARSAPPLRLGRLRAGGIVEIDAAELAFTRHELDALTRAAGLGVSDGGLARFLSVTEGWPAALALLRRDLTGPDDGDLRGDLAGYLVEEVFLAESAESREFLLTLAVLDRFDPEVARRVSGRADAAAAIDDLVARQLFVIRLDGPREEYRFHHLFHGFLRDRVAAGGGVAVAARQRRAAVALADHDPIASARHAMAAGDDTLAVTVLRPAAERACSGPAAGELADLLGRLDPAVRDRHPELVLAGASLALGRGEHEGSFASLEDAIGQLIREGEADRAVVAFLRLLQAMVSAGTPPARRIAAGERWAPLFDTASEAAAVARILHASAYAYAGRYSDAERQFEAVVRSDAARGADIVAVYALVARAFYVQLQVESPERALLVLDDGIADLARNEADDLFGYAVYARFFRTYALVDAGRNEDALVEIARTRRFAEARGLAEAQERGLAWATAMALAGLGRWDELAAVLAPPGHAAGRRVATSYGYRFRLPAAHLAAHRGDGTEVANHVAVARREMAAFGRVSDDPMALCELANAAVQVGLHPIAVDLAGQAGAFAAADRTPRSQARALLVRARACQDGARRDEDIAGTLDMTERHGFAGLWTRRDRPAAAEVLPRAIAAGLGPPGVAGRLAEDCGGEVLAACASALGPASVRRRGVRRGIQARPPLRVSTLGGLRVAIGDRPVSDGDFGRAKARALLGALVVAGGPLQRDVLLEWLWPALPPERGAAALRTTVHALRRALEPGLRAREERSVIVSDGDHYGLEPKAGDHVDLHDFLRLAREMPMPEDPAERLATLERAEALYRGPLLPEWPYEEWTLAPREAVEVAFRDLLERLGAALVDEGRPRAAIAHLRRLLALDPLSEESHRALMRAYAAAGERGLALRQFHACRAALRREQGVEPAAATRELYGSLLVDEPGGPSVTRA